MPVQLRPARPEDRDALLALIPRLRAFGDAPLRTPAQLDGAERDTLAAALASPAPERAVFVATLPEVPVAGVAYVHDSTDYFTGEVHGHLDILAVAEAAEGRGAGRALMEAAEAWSAGRGHRFLTLNVFARNERARAIYERAGFGQDTIRYIKPLAGTPTPG